MYLDILLISIILLTSIIWTIDACFGAKRRRAKLLAVLPPGVSVTSLDKKGIKPIVAAPLLVEYARVILFFALLIAGIRAFVAEPFYIPSNSMRPTLFAGDYILVDKMVYGFTLPFSQYKFFAKNGPRRGDIAVFRWSREPSVDYVKRIVALPGDTVSYKNKVIYINDQPVIQTPIGNAHDVASQNTFPVQVAQEDLPGVVHQIYLRPDVAARDSKKIKVPNDMLFVLGDNRDNSQDSRDWGLVAKADLVGKVVLIWFSWDPYTKHVRWERIGQSVH
jgi:signal peptidase I